MSMKKPTTQLKVMHKIDADKDGKNPTITSTVSNPPKLREAVNASKLPPIRKPSTAGIEKDSKPKDTAPSKDVPKGQLLDEQRAVLQALSDLGGKDIHSMDIAKRLGFDKTHKNAPRAPVRNAMKELHTLHFVTSKKEGAKFSFSITDKGKEALNHPHETEDIEAKDEKAGSAVKAAPASNPSNVGLNEGVLKAVGHVVPAAIRPANTDVQCQACKTWNPYMAEFCRECGKPIRAAPIAA